MSIIIVWYSSILPQHYGGISAFHFAIYEESAGETYSQEDQDTERIFVLNVAGRASAKTI